MAQIESERGVDRSVLVRAISDSLLSACKKKFENAENLRVELNELTGETRVFAEKEVIEKVTDEETQISLEEAMEYDDSFKVGDILEIEVTPDDFGRIAAQTAKQVIIQRIREAEKNSIFNEFKGKEGTIISGVVQKLERRNILINLGRIETILGPSDQIPGEIYKPKDRIKLYVVEVRKTPKGPQVVTSRSHPRMLQKLFELEIPEIQDGIIEVKGVSRDPGSRSKIAVKSNNPDIGAVGTCVGKMGSRIQAIIREIGNEKIDIVEWSEDPETLISNALKPAKIARIKIVDLKEKKAEITVPDDQLSLAIGKGGQNVRLAAKLTNWKIDILKLSDIRAVEEQHIKEQEEILIKEVAKRQAEENTLPTEDQE
ncbi:MAG: transcription termination/antitermination protein NusA [Candidatus Margulisiibacteriota bacterium]|nr:MAG: transcription termination/antitermination protein NusA [Candidatus Margulisiibacteriota bacterium]HAR62259.1 transcription termination/antitermination protein NusA [Candidatus Margulisiibacteriota bacterium]HCT86436.1 transcription termination/antitermination protein NusA [Candidatus Margulisiibacteriota bacterium]HCY35568.1 transcription termination/antitermination protein NusA [Candidatus Margulisiibacteriota bacterium]